jgi:hypothetical protein
LLEIAPNSIPTQIATAPKRIAKITRRQRPSGNEAASQSEIVTSKTACRRFTIDVFINSCRSYVVNLNACCAAIVII